MENLYICSHYFLIKKITRKQLKYLLNYTVYLIIEDLYCLS